jgi:phosphatidylinositol-3-phosphatase
MGVPSTPYAVVSVPVTSTSSPRVALCRAALVLLLITAGSRASRLPGAAAAAPSPIAAGTPSSPTALTTVFLIIMENHDWSTIKGNPSAPYLNRLLQRPDVAYASNYHNVPPLAALHPSEGNYLWLEAGTDVFPDRTFLVDQAPSAANSTRSTAHLVTLLHAKGILWMAYQEDSPSDTCPISNVDHYAVRHNPVMFFQDVVGRPPSMHNAYCQQHVRPYADLGPALEADTARGYNILTPNLCHDMHRNDCPGNDDVVKQGDDWLAAQLPMLLNAPVYQRGQALIAITWDEGTSGNQPIGMILLSPQTKGNGYTNAREYTHASWVKTVEELFGLSPLLGHAADPTTLDLGDFFPTGLPGVASTPAEAPGSSAFRPVASSPRLTMPGGR